MPEGLSDEVTAFCQIEEQLNGAADALRSSTADLEEKTEKRNQILDEMRNLQGRIDKAGANASVQKLVSLLRTLRVLERQESDFQSRCSAAYSQWQTKIIKLEEELENGADAKHLSDDLDHCLSACLEKLDSVKRELADRLRAILSLRRQLDNVPVQSELIQYERRFTELNVQIQEKHRQTRKYYSTYNALLEIKDMMLKEISLLNSISSQVHDAISSPAGRSKLIDSMDGIVKGAQQKLEKVQLGIQTEQHLCDTLKGTHNAAIAKQRQCYSLLKAFREECTKNKKLRGKSSA